jgi:replicative DNA helicase
MTTADAYVPPQNLEAEESVLGAMMVSETAVASVIVDVHLTDIDFYRERHRLIFRAIHSLHSKGEPVDALTVTEQLTQLGDITEAGGKELVSSLASTVPVAGNADHYARIVKANAMLRRLLEASHRIQKSVHEREGEPRDLVEQAEKMMFEVAHDTAAQDFASLTEILERETTRLEELADGKRELTGTASGFTDLDKITGGFQPGNLIILAARPAMGKSAIVGNIADFVAVETGLPVAFFSLEMSETELAHRFLACRASIRGDLLRKGQVKSLWPKVLKASNKLANAPIWIDTSSDLSTLELRAKARRLYSKQGGLGLIIVDYMQLMRPDDPRQSRVEQVGAISRGLKLLAGELDVPVLGLSQLSRAPELRPDKRPILSDLRESGALEQDSDVVCFLFREEYYKREEGDLTDDDVKGKAELIIAKHRNGPIGTVELAFQSPYPRFRNMAKGYREAAPVARGGYQPEDDLSENDDPVDLADDF